MDDVQNGDGACAPVTDGANYANRLWNVGDDERIDVFDTCGTCDVEPVVSDVTLTLDANCFSGEVTSVGIKQSQTGGSWWDAPAEVTDNGDGTYSFTFTPDGNNDILLGDQ